MKNIIFFVDAKNSASGGAKIIYQYSSYINSLNEFTSSIVHLEKKKKYKWLNSLHKKTRNKNKKKETGWQFKELKVKKGYSYSWFDQKINIKENLDFDHQEDFIILPEIFAHFAKDFLIKEKIPYSIFVQNGYSIFPTNNIKKLNLAYKKAKFILSYSKDIRKCISLAYPKEKRKIIDVNYAIDSNKFNFKIKKENLISYMPRKLPKHSELVISFLNNSLPKKWKIKAIQNLSEKEVYKVLEKSKIFLAFSDLEGLPLPPVEAAIAGNKVIGYTGEGGKEYWKEPIFTEIKSSEIKSFCKTIIKNLKIKNFSKKTYSQRKKLFIKFSTLKERQSIRKFLQKV
jgi:hypothetical protein